MQSECPFCRAQNQAEALHCVECQRALRPGPQSIPPHQVMRNPPMPPIIVPPMFNPPPPVGNPPFIRPLPPTNPPPIADSPFPQPILPPIIALEVDLTEKGQPTQTHRFDKTEVILGRVAPPSDIVMRKGNVSKRHCRVFVQNNLVFIEDLKTTNGTEVNGKKITTPHQISAGNKIYVSDFTIQVRSITGAQVAPPPPNNIAPLPPNPPFHHIPPPLIRANPPIVPVAVQYRFEVLVRDPNKVEQIHRVTKEELTIGRGVNANDVVVPSGVLSRRHMKIFIKDKKLFVEDLNSTNGVTIDGKKIIGPQEFNVTEKLSVNNFDLWVRASGPGLKEQPPLPTGAGVVCTIEAKNSQGDLIRKTFQQPHIVLGRHTSVDFILSGSNVSKRHACIVAETSGFYIFDLDSTNGLIIKDTGQRIESIKTAGNKTIEIGEFTVALSLGLPEKQPEPASKDIIAGEAFYFLADSLFQGSTLRWLIPTVGAENIPRVIPFTRGDIELPGAPPKNKPSQPKKLVLPDSAVLLPGRFLREVGPPDPIQLKPLERGTLQLQIVQPMRSIVVQVFDREAPSPRTDAINPATAEDPSKSDQLYQVANKFFEQDKLIEARAVFEEARLAQTNPHPFYAYNVACCEAGLGNTNQAMQWLQVAISDGWLDMKHMNQDEDLASLRDNPAFAKLSEKGMREYRFAQLHPGDTLQIERFPATLLLVGAFVGGHPWESSVSL